MDLIVNWSQWCHRHEGLVGRWYLRQALPQSAQLHGALDPTRGWYLSLCVGCTRRWTATSWWGSRGFQSILGRLGPNRDYVPPVPNKNMYKYNFDWKHAEGNTLKDLLFQSGATKDHQEHLASCPPWISVGRLIFDSPIQSNLQQLTRSWQGTTHWPVIEPTSSYIVYRRVLCAYQFICKKWHLFY